MGRLLKRLTPEILIAAFLIISILCVYYQVTTFDFVNFDDHTYVKNNPEIKQGISLHGIQWAFSSIYASNWHPITWLSHMLDVEFFGLSPGMHHLTNVLFHTVNTLLLFYIFYRMTGEKWKCAFVASLFALHPLHVESVAWISERKDVLSTLFWMLTVLTYLWFLEHRNWGRYLLMTALYSLGLMAKSMLVTLPFIMLLLDFWPLKRPELAIQEADISSHGKKKLLPLMRWHGVIFLFREKLVLFILAAIASAITFNAQKTGGALNSIGILPITTKIENALISYSSYLGKMFWPFHLAIVYPYPGYFSLLFATSALLMIVLVTVLTLMAARRFPYLVVGWLWYLGTLIPVIGIVQVGYQSMADRYTYIPLIGIFVMLVWGLSSLFGRRPSGRYIFIPSSIAIILVLMWTSWVQAGYWKNSITLFSHALEVTKNNYIAQNNLGVALYNDGNIEGSIRHYHEALNIKPDYETARNNLVIALIRKEKYGDAIAQCRELLRLTPTYAQAHYNLGLALSALGKTDEAIREYSKAIELNPMDAEAHNNLGVALESQGKFAESSSHFRKALRINPGLAKARTNLDRSLQGLKPNP